MMLARQCAADEEALGDDLAARRVRDLVAKTQENSTNVSSECKH